MLKFGGFNQKKCQCVIVKPCLEDVDTEVCFTAEGTADVHCRSLHRITDLHMDFSSLKLSCYLETKKVFIADGSVCVCVPCDHWILHLKDEAWTLFRASSCLLSLSKMVSNFHFYSSFCKPQTLYLMMLKNGSRLVYWFKSPLGS